MSVSLAAAAEDWAAYKRVASHDQFGYSAAARVDDLIRFARALRQSRGEAVHPVFATLEEEYACLTTADLGADGMLAAFVALKDAYRPSTVRRTFSTVRGFVQWMVRRGLLASDPIEDLRLPPPSFDESGVVLHAFTAAEMDRLYRAATTPPPSLRTAWPERDLAVLRLAATCGTRASEVCALQVRHVDRRFEYPVLRLVLGTKGAKPREVPVPGPTIAALDTYLADRAGRLGVVSHDAPLFVRLDGRRFDRSFLDRLVRRVARDAGVRTPEQAATHALRHHFGVQLALRGVAVPVLQMLLGHADSRTTAVYTRLAAHELVAALDDAGWM